MKSKKDTSNNLRHSAAHLLAHAVLELFPKTLITIGPVTDHGFYYDFLPEKNFKNEDLESIENKMHELAKQDLKIAGKEISKTEAKKLFKNNKFKLEIIDSLPENGKITIYSQGDFVDLCKGGHVASTGKIKYFKLTGISGSYWRADRSGQALQRISGVAFETKKELDEYLQKLEDLKLYDHRVLGKQLDLFSFHEESPGIVFFHDKGTRIFNELIDFMRNLQDGDGYQEIKTPLIMNESLWRTSGHYENYKDNMFFTKIDGTSHCVRPMNCPGGILIYKERPHSYKELPIRVSEFGMVHRCELSGVLHGLLRVRGFTQDDGHVYCTEEQVVDEISKILDLTNTVYKKFDFKNIKFVVSTKPEKAIGSDELWETATEALKNALEKNSLPFSVNEGEGAFYGPKIEVIIEDAMGREWQCGTVQVDFFLPKNFNLEYIDSDQSKKQPVMIHRAIYGSLERFIGILTEHFKGHFPFWLAPVQARILTITDKQVDYAKKVLEELKSANLRIEIDESGDQISAQIKRAQLEKLPWMIVIGKKEEEQNTVTLRHSNGKQEFGLKVKDLISRSNTLIE